MARYPELGLMTHDQASSHYATTGQADNLNCECDGLRNNMSSSEQTQSLPQETTTFFIYNVRPSREWNVQCQGTKLGRPHVMTAHHVMSAFQSVSDTNDEIKPSIVAKYGVCSDGSEQLLQPAVSMMSSQLTLGVSCILTSFEQVCVEPLQLGQVANFKATATIEQESIFAELNWRTTEGQAVFADQKGAAMSISYTKKETKTEPEQRDILFQVCSDAQINFPTQHSCREYKVPIKALDISITVGKFKMPGLRRLQESFGSDGEANDFGARTLTEVTSLETQSATVPVGTELGVEMATDVANFDWSTVRIHLGLVTGPTRGFEQALSFSGENNETISWKAMGLGINLPLNLFWENMEFFLSCYITITTPQYADPDYAVEIPLTGSRIYLTPEFVGSPMAAGTEAEKAKALAGSNAPDPKQFQLLSYEADGRTFSNMCEETEYVDSTVTVVDEQAQSWTLLDWAKPRCKVYWGAYSGMSLRLKVRDFLTGAWVEVARTKEDRVGYKRPLFTTIGKKNAEGAVITGMVQTNDFKYQEFADGTALIYIMSEDDFPDISQVDVTGASLTGWGLNIEPQKDAPAGSPMPKLCNQVTRDPDNFKTLICQVSRCLDIRWASTLPKIKVQLGDLLSDEMASLLQLPQPITESVTPTDSGDVGNELFVITGQNFGNPCCGDRDFEAVCTDWLYSTEATPASGDVPGIRGFGPLEAKIGDAPCVIEQYFADGQWHPGHQNEKITCRTTGQKRAPRDVLTKGDVFAPLIGSKKVQTEITIGISFLAMTPQEVQTRLEPCPEGWRRIKEDEAECEPCPPGLYSSSATSQFPLQCEYCPGTSYQDQPGQATCKLCPDNSQSIGFADTVEACRCLPGYYSPFLAPGEIFGMPGRRCEQCHGPTLVGDVPKGIECGKNAELLSVCSEPLVDACVMSQTGFGYKICKTYCLGGIQWPKAKAYFSLAKNSALDGTQGNATGSREFRPVIMSCDPISACLADNKCSEGYAGMACSECAQFYWRDTDAWVCNVCDESEIFGMILMGCICVVLSVGAFFGSMIYMKFQADPIFKATMISIAKANLRKLMLLLDEVKKMAASLMWRRTKVLLTAQSLGIYYRYVTKKDMGVVFRLCPTTKRAHVVGTRPGSPAQAMGIKRNWILQLANGRSVRAKGEYQLVTKIQSLKAPVEYLFKAPRKDPPDSDDEEVNMDDMEDLQESSASLVRMFTMCMGMMQSFNVMGKIDLAWPPEFKMVKAFVAQFMLSFDFFHPECSVASPWEYKWFFQLIIPYCMVVPLSVSNMLIRSVIMRANRNNPSYCEMQSWLLSNAMARTLNTVMLVFMPVHLELLSAAHQCLEREDGAVVMAVAQDIPCDLNSARYFRIWMCSTTLFAGALACCCVFASNFYRSYHWQTGLLVRDKIPIYVAMVEVSTEGTQGYQEDVRDRVFNNVASVKLFHDGVQGAKGRELLEMLSIAHGEERDLCPKNAQTLVKGIDNWRYALKSVEENTGSVLTYSWIVSVNTLGRQFMLSMCLMLTADFPPMGAAMHCLIFAINFFALLACRPYDAELLNRQEAFLLMCMAVLVWFATFSEMLNDHRRASEFQLIVWVFAQAVTVMVFILMISISSILGFNILTALKMVTKSTPADQALNALAWDAFKQTQKMKRRERRAEQHQFIRELFGMDGLDEEALKETRSRSVASDMPKFIQEKDDLIEKLVPRDRVLAEKYFNTQAAVLMRTYDRPAFMFEETSKDILAAGKRAALDERIMVNAWKYGASLQHAFEVVRPNMYDFEFEMDSPNDTQLRAFLREGPAEEQTWEGRVFMGLLLECDTNMKQKMTRQGEDAFEIDEEEVVGEVKLAVVPNPKSGRGHYCRIAFAWKDEVRRLGSPWRGDFSHAQGWCAYLADDVDFVHAEFQKAYNSMFGRFLSEPADETEPVVELNLKESAEGQILVFHTTNHRDLLASVLPVQIFDELGPYWAGDLKADDGTVEAKIKLRVDVLKSAVVVQVHSDLEFAARWDEIDEVSCFNEHEVLGKADVPQVGLRVRVANLWTSDVVVPEGTVIAVTHGGKRCQVMHDDSNGTVKYRNCGWEDKYDLFIMTSAMEKEASSRVIREYTSQTWQLTGTWELATVPPEMEALLAETPDALDQKFEIQITQEDSDGDGRQDLTYQTESRAGMLLPDGEQAFGVPWIFKAKLVDAKDTEVKAGTVLLRYELQTGEMQLIMKQANEKGKLAWDEDTPKATYKRTGADPPKETMTIVGARMFDGTYIMQAQQEQDLALDIRPAYWLSEDGAHCIFLDENGYWNIAPAGDGPVGGTWAAMHPAFGCPPHTIMHTQWARYSRFEGQWFREHLFVARPTSHTEPVKKKKKKQKEASARDERSDRKSRKDDSNGKPEQQDGSKKTNKSRMAAIESMRMAKAKGLGRSARFPAGNEGALDDADLDTDDEIEVAKDGKSYSIASLPSEDEERKPEATQKQDNKRASHSPSELQDEKRAGKPDAHEKKEASERRESSQRQSGLSTASAKEIPVEEAVSKHPVFEMAVFVNSPDKASMHGMYLKVKKQTVNNYPLWRQQGGSHWIFSGHGKQMPDGLPRWWIGDEDQEAQKFSLDEGRLVSMDAHNGKMPHEVTQQWEYLDEDSGAPDFVLAPEISMTAPPKLPKKLFVGVRSLRGRANCSGTYKIADVLEDMPAWQQVNGKHILRNAGLQDRGLAGRWALFVEATKEAAGAALLSSGMPHHGTLPHVLLPSRGPWRVKENPNDPFSRWVDSRAVTVCLAGDSGHITWAIETIRRCVRAWKLRRSLRLTAARAKRLNEAPAFSNDKYELALVKSDRKLYSVEDVGKHVLRMQAIRKAGLALRERCRREKIKEGSCPAGHALTRSIVKDGPTSCLGICGEAFDSSPDGLRYKRWSCAECKYAICTSCKDRFDPKAKIRDVLPCPAGHKLHRSVAEFDEWACDICSKDIAPPGVVWSCPKCEYDICAKCYTGRKASEKEDMMAKKLEKRQRRADEKAGRGSLDSAAAPHPNKLPSAPQGNGAEHRSRGSTQSADQGNAAAVSTSRSSGSRSGDQVSSNVPAAAQTGDTRGVDNTTRHKAKPRPPPVSEDPAIDRKPTSDTHKKLKPMPPPPMGSNEESKASKEEGNHPGLAPGAMISAVMSDASDHGEIVVATKSKKAKPKPPGAILNAAEEAVASKPKKAKPPPPSALANDPEGVDVEAAMEQMRAKKKKPGPPAPGGLAFGHSRQDADPTQQQMAFGHSRQDGDATQQEMAFGRSRQDADATQQEMAFGRAPQSQDDQPTMGHMPANQKLPEAPLHTE
eukprot:TRINITY_DN8746_c0_g1_i1.p1 TRINITY_DN8746_c0_g1~~TRINITY_DN8746_c0_g1_i1.p1  ORF type:complete len:3771 (+),score=770.29 TRINITY_DN8746_c0_g1_i1:1443-11315(+)